MSGEGFVSWFESNGASPPTFTEQVVATITDPRSAFATDFDNDGDIDVVTAEEVYVDLSGNTRDTSLMTVLWYENAGDNVAFTRHDIEGVSVDNPGNFDINNYGFVAAGDMDGDGNTDVVATFRYNNLIRWWPNVCVPFTGPTPAPTHATTNPPTTDPTTSPPTTATKLPTTTPAPSGVKNCQDDAVDQTLAQCEKLSAMLAQTQNTFDTFCADFKAEFAP